MKYCQDINHSFDANDMTTKVRKIFQKVIKINKKKSKKRKWIYENPDKAI